MNGRLVLDSAKGKNCICSFTNQW